MRGMSWVDPYQQGDAWYAMVPFPHFCGEIPGGGLRLTQNREKHATCRHLAPDNFSLPPPRAEKAGMRQLAPQVGAKGAQGDKQGYALHPPRADLPGYRGGWYHAGPNQGRFLDIATLDTL